jgi:hypothetical protein
VLEGVEDQLMEPLDGAGERDEFWKAGSAAPGDPPGQQLSGVPPGRWTSKAGSLVGQLRGCSRGDSKKIIHGGVPG